MTTTVAELIDQLRKMPQDLPVFTTLSAVDGYTNIGNPRAKKVQVVPCGNVFAFPVPRRDIGVERLEAVYLLGVL